MAGATLVAAGNGAPDLVMTALAGCPTMGFHACWFPSFPWRCEWWNHKIQAPTTIESLHIVICDTICWGPSWEGTWNDGSRMHGCMHHLHYRHPLCGGRCSSFYALENSSRQGSSEEELHDTVTKHHSFMQAEAKRPFWYLQIFPSIDSLSLQEHHRPIRRPRANIS